MKLIIVESPNKVKTIRKILDKHFPNQFTVKATKGHILNLPYKEVGIDFSLKDKTLDIKWVVEKGKQWTIDDIKKVSKDAQITYVATDDDREGEKIAYDVVKKCNIKNYKRVVFLEITEKEILKKLFDGREINKNIVNAAIARRAIDRLIGYPISTIIREDFYARGENVKPRGVGRVISPSLHILIDLEKQIESFVVEEHQRIKISYVKDGLSFEIDSPLSFSPSQRKELDEYLLALKTNPHIVSYYKQKTEERNPPKPLTTSTLQYGAWYLYNFKPKKTMKLAQELFERGLITYHRTDSTRLSYSAMQEMMDFIYQKYGDEYIVSKLREYKSTNANAQDAHEAIRPTIFDEDHTPERIAKTEHIEDDDLIHLYEFIWYRTIVTQMKPAIYDVSVVEVNIGGNEFKGKANFRLFDGWENIKGEIIKMSVRGDEEEWKYKDIKLPEFNIGETLTPLNIYPYKYTPHRPRRFGIGRFVAYLSNHSIARPSTLDSIIENLEKKDYISINKGMLFPKYLGNKVDKWLEENVEWLIDLELAKKFEDELDLVERGESDYKDLIFAYAALINDLEKEFKINSMAQPPSQAQINLINSIAKENNIDVNEGVFKNKKLANTFIQAHLKEVKEDSFGKCPICKKGYILKKENRLYCNNKNCNFVLFNYQNFFDIFKIEHNEKFIDLFYKELFSKKTLYLPYMMNKKEISFSAFVKIKKKDKFYNLELDFKKAENKDMEVIKKIYKESGIDFEKISLKNEVEKLEEEKRMLKNAQLKDGLTRAFNRGTLNEDVKKFKNMNNDFKLDIAFVDADHFKKVNDTYGHKMGDEVLINIVNIVFQKIREFNIKGRLYRYGGEEFLIIAKSLNNFKDFLESVRNALQNHKYRYNNIDFTVTASIGYVKGVSNKNIEKGIEMSDKGVYESKENGRNRITLMQ